MSTVSFSVSVFSVGVVPERKLQFLVNPVFAVVAPRLVQDAGIVIPAVKLIAAFELQHGAAVFFIFGNGDDLFPPRSFCSLRA